MTGNSSATSVILILFAFSDNLSTEKSKSSADFSIQLIQLLKCMAPYNQNLQFVESWLLRLTLNAWSFSVLFWKLADKLIYSGWHWRKDWQIDLLVEKLSDSNVEIFWSNERSKYIWIWNVCNHKIIFWECSVKEQLPYSRHFNNHKFSPPAPPLISHIPDIQLQSNFEF